MSGIAHIILERSHYVTCSVKIELPGINNCDIENKSATINIKRLLNIIISIFTLERSFRAFALVPASSKLLKSLGSLVLCQIGETSMS